MVSKIRKPYIYIVSCLLAVLVTTAGGQVAQATEHRTETLVVKHDTQEEKQTVIPVLAYGMKNHNVWVLQKSLQNLGYEIAVDGSFGPTTRQVVKQYQKDHELPADGSVGPQTAASINFTLEQSGYVEENNEYPLYDDITLSEDIVDYMRTLVNNVTKPEMTKEEKLRACFLHIGNRLVYPYMQDRIPYYHGDDWPVVYAHDMMYKGGSTCHGYSSLFGYAAVLCGYENVHWCQSNTHAWVDIDGLLYDPVYYCSSYETDVFGWTYEYASTQAARLGADYTMTWQEGDYRYIRVPAFA